MYSRFEICFTQYNESTICRIWFRKLVDVIPAVTCAGSISNIYSISFGGWILIPLPWFSIFGSNSFDKISVGSSGGVDSFESSCEYNKIFHFQKNFRRFLFLREVPMHYFKHFLLPFSCWIVLTWYYDKFSIFSLIVLAHHLPNTSPILPLLIAYLKIRFVLNFAKSYLVLYFFPK